MLQEIGYAWRHYPAIDSEDVIKMATSVPALDASIGDLSVGKKADLVVIKARPDPKARNIFDPVVKATPADILLVVVGGGPLYGDPDLMKQLRPGATLDDMTVCGVPKKLYLGESDAPALKEGFGKIQDTLNAALMKAGAKLPEIECE